MEIIIPFDYRRLECRYPVMDALLTSIIYADDTYVCTRLQEFVDDMPNREAVYDHLLSLAMSCYNELCTLCYQLLRPYYINGYDIIDAKTLGTDTRIIMQGIHDNEQDCYYLNEFK